MFGKKKRYLRIGMSVLGLMLTGWVGAAVAANPSAGPPPVGTRLPGGLRIVGVKPGKAPQKQTVTQSAVTPLSTPFPRPPLNGFSPLVVLTTSDRHKTGDVEWEHEKRTGYFGNPLHAPAEANYVIGIFDSGSTVDFISYCDSGTLGMTGSNLTANTVPLQGASGEVDAYISQPRGYFAGGLSAILPNGLLDLTKLIGHTNVSVVVMPPETCGDAVELPSVAGNPMVAYWTTVMRNDLPHHVMFGDQTVVSPDLQMFTPGSPGIPTYPLKISMEIGGLVPMTTSSFYGDFEDFRTPIIPTMLSFSNQDIPFGGAFFSTIGLLEGPASPTNPLQSFRVMVDTGAESSIISSGVAADLNLPSEPDFTVDVLGVGGVEHDLPGYYIDYVKINAINGPMEFSQAPFVMIDLESPEGGALDGVMGMNLFWNRNVIFQPSLTTTGSFQASNAIPFAWADFNRDFHVDDLDFDFFQFCVSGPNVPQLSPYCVLLDLDGDGDVDADEFSVFQRCYSGATVQADPNCS